MNHTWTKRFDLLETLDAELQSPQRLLVMGGRLYLKQEDRGCNIYAVSKRQDTVIETECSAKQIEYRDDRSGRGHTLD